MTAYPWVAFSGSLVPEEAFSRAEAFAKEHLDSRYIAFHTDHFSAGRAGTLAEEWTPELLEIRVFSDHAECYLARTCIGRDFQIRVADDEMLNEKLKSMESKNAFLGEPDHHRIITRQVLDINTEDPAFKAKLRDEKGCLRLCTTGGGHYSLPIEEDDRVAIVVHYLRYDEKTGVCSAEDMRLAGFEPLKGGENQ